MTENLKYKVIFVVGYLSIIFKISEPLVLVKILNAIFLLKNLISFISEQVIY